jgi:hypothetical protein
LLTGDVRTVYDRSRQAVADNGEGLRIRLRINAPDLATAPWEFLYDPRAGEFLALSRLTPIVRYLELPLGEQMLAVKPPLRILGLVAGPADAPPLDVQREQQRLEQALQPLQAKGQVELVWLEGSKLARFAGGDAGRAVARLPLRRPRCFRPAQRRGRPAAGR